MSLNVCKSVLRSQLRRENNTLFSDMVFVHVQGNIKTQNFLRQKFLPQRIAAEIPAAFQKIRRKPKNATKKNTATAFVFREFPLHYRRFPPHFRRFLPQIRGWKKLKTTSAAIFKMPQITVPQDKLADKAKQQLSLQCDVMRRCPQRRVSSAAPRFLRSAPLAPTTSCEVK